MSVRLDHGEDTLNEVHEINVTPFIDVMLVLLIIFMVAAPLATVDIQVNLPGLKRRTAASVRTSHSILTVKSDLTLALGKILSRANMLGSTLDARPTGTTRSTRIFLRADKAVPYGEMMEVMNFLRAAGYLKLALVGLEKVRRAMMALERRRSRRPAPLGDQRRHCGARAWRGRRRRSHGRRQRSGASPPPRS